MNKLYSYFNYYYYRESGDKSNVKCNWGPQKRVSKAKSLGNPDLTDSPRFKKGW